MGFFTGSLLAFSPDGADAGYDDFPLRYIFKESYQVTPNRRQDLDSARTASGLLKRNVLDHTATTISFQTKPMWNDDMEAMMDFLNAHYTNPKHKRCRIKYYSPDASTTDGSNKKYPNGFFYLADVEYLINRVEGNKIFYNSMTLSFIEY